CEHCVHVSREGTGVEVSNQRAPALLEKARELASPTHDDGALRSKHVTELVGPSTAIDDVVLKRQRKHVRCPNVRWEIFVGDASWRQEPLLDPELGCQGSQTLSLRANDQKMHVLVGGKRHRATKDFAAAVRISNRPNDRH